MNILVSLRKESFSNKKSTSQKTTNSKIYIAPSDMYCDALSNSDWPEILIQYIKIPSVIFSKISTRSNSQIKSYTC